MKSSELMIGEYLIAETINKPIRIAAIHKYKVGYRANDTNIAWVGRGLISPIPLTFEPYTNNEFEWSARRDFDGATNSTPIRIHYVHELQHLLKLFNIQKI